MTLDDRTAAIKKFKSDKGITKKKKMPHGMAKRESCVANSFEWELQLQHQKIKKPPTPQELFCVLTTFKPSLLSSCHSSLVALVSTLQMRQQVIHDLRRSMLTTLVVILDPWWNPAAEQQAVDRVRCSPLDLRNFRVFLLVCSARATQRIFSRSDYWLVLRYTELAKRRKYTFTVW